MSTQSCFIVGPPSATMIQRWWATTYSVIPTLKRYRVRLVFAGKLTVHCVGHPRVHQARLMTDVRRNQRTVFCLFYLGNFEYICNSISYIHDINGN